MAIEQQLASPELNYHVIFKEKPPPGQHQRVWNAPTNNQLFGILTNYQGGDQKRNIIIQCKGTNLLRDIWETHAMYDPLHYVLLFPYGTLGWNLYMKNKSQKRLTALKYYRYRIMERKIESNHIFRGGLLFQKYLVDMWSKVLLQQLRFCELNQDKLRAACYQEIIDAEKQGLNTNNIGKRIILPSTIPGSDRYMSELFLDFMAIVRECEVPTAFITMTCNKQWKEIKRELLPGQIPEDRPDIINRVFQEKLKRLIKDLTENNVFGKTIANIYVIEFQKRGLPHAHILIFLSREDKPKTPEEVDRMVTAEIPNPKINPILYQLVKEKMIHKPCSGPCYDPSENHPCLNKNGLCDKRFPFAYQKYTILPDNKYAQVKRTPPEQGGFVFDWKKRNGKTVTRGAEWVVK